MFFAFFYSSLYCWQFLNGLFVLRMALKGLVELCEDENQFLQCLEGTGRFEKLLKAVIQTINMIDEAAIGISYHLQLESVQLIIMVSISLNSIPLEYIPPLNSFPPFSIT